MSPLFGRSETLTVRGDLAGLSLPEILQTLRLGTRTARVSLLSDGRRGFVWVEDGELRNAESGSLVGGAALFEMLQWTHGDFTIEHGVRTCRRTLRQDSEMLVLECMRRIDEASLRKPASGEGPRPVRRSRRWMRASALAAVAVLLILGGGVGPRLAPETLSKETPEPPAVRVYPPIDPNDLIPMTPRRVGAMERPSRKKAGENAARAVVPVPADPVEAEPIDEVDPPPVTLVPAVTVPVEEAVLELRGRSRVKDGILTVYVDEQEAYSIPLSRRDGGGMDFRATLPVEPGSHTLCAVLDLPRKAAVYERSVEFEIEPGGRRPVTLVLGRILGRRVKLRVEEPEPPTER